MKRTVFVAAALVALAGTAYVANRVGAQNNGAAKPPAAAPATLKMGIVNINKVIKNYEKANSQGDILLKKSKAFADELNKKRVAIQSATAKAQTEPDPVKREQMAKQARDEERNMQEMELDIRKKLSDEQAEMAKAVNAEVQSVIDACAKSYGLELVMSYPGVSDDKEKGTAQDAFRRLSAPAAMPVYMHSGLDITDAVVATLNKYYPAAKAAGGDAPGAATPAGFNKNP